MKFSRTVAYALQATLQLAQDGSKQPIPCSRLASEGSMPERFLLQILRNLVMHGILDSTRGVEGGYRLAREPADVSLLEVIEAVDGPLVSTLSFHKGIAESSKAKLECALTEVAELARKALQSIKLTDLLPSVEETQSAAG